MENPEVHHPHGRHGGLPRWLELVIAVTALITSISSIAIAVHHSKIMERLVQANSVPYLQGGFSDVTPEGERMLSLDLLNRGVGPAHEKSLRVRVDDRYVNSVDELIAASLGLEGADAGEALEAVKNVVATRFIPGGEQQMVFRIPRTEANARYWDLLQASQRRWQVGFCYCSVFGDCWQVPNKWVEPVATEECVRDEPNEFVP